LEIQEYLSDRQTDSRDPPSRIYLPMESKKNKNLGDSTMKIQERDSRDRSRLEIFLPAALCTSSLSGESMRRGAS
jgi:hypothetical protein